MRMIRRVMRGFTGRRCLGRSNHTNQPLWRGSLLWRGGLPPFGCEAVVNQALRFIWQTAANEFGAASPPNGGKPPRHSSLATGDSSLLLFPCFCNVRQCELIPAACINIRNAPAATPNATTLYQPSKMLVPRRRCWFTGINGSHRQSSLCRAIRSGSRPCTSGLQFIIDPVDHPVINSDWTPVKVALSLRSTSPQTT